MTDDALPVLVMGMHRSGTSAVAGALRAAGLNAGGDQQLFSPSKDNPRGYVERRDVVAFNEGLLNALGLTWDTPPPGPAARPAVDEHEVLTGRRLLDDAFSGRTDWFIKDPRLSLVLPTWRRILNDRFVAVVVVRPTAEVAASLALRDGFTPAFGAALCAAYARHLAAGLVGLPVVVIDYEAMTENPGRSVGELLSSLEHLGVAAPLDPVAAAASIAPGLRARQVTQRAVLPTAVDASLDSLHHAWATAPVVIYQNFAMTVAPASAQELAILATRDGARATGRLAGGGGSVRAAARRLTAPRGARRAALQRAGQRVALHLPAAVYANPLFDRDWYVSHYLDVREQGMNPYRHYRRHGVREGRNPNAWFDTAWYRETNPDVVRTGMDPLNHYLVHGGRESRRPSPTFDAAFYLHQNPDVAAAGTNPLMHYMRHGRFEGRELSLGGAATDTDATRPEPSASAAGLSGTTQSRPTDERDAVLTPRARLIAFYLPQFYPTTENNRWWGPGFTEWTNVARAVPLFRGHDQPRLPADLGFYDLRVPEVRQQQADLAIAHGIEAFCYWHFWFEGRRLLERPFAEVQASGQPNLPFCLSWANESWSRRWHGTGGDAEVLMAQTYSNDDDVAHAQWLAEAFADERYLRVAGRPLFLIYRPYALPDPRRTTDTLRRVVIATGLPEPYLVGINAHNPTRDARDVGFDCTLDFEPQLGVLEKADRRGLKTYDYLESVRRMRASVRDYPTHPSVFVSWDNTPRRGSEGVVFTGSDPAAFKRSLGDVLDRVQSQPLERRLVFLNAWNEWAEGNHLEPDLRFGMGWLEAVRSQGLVAGAGDSSQVRPR